jgi:Spy/CpxP family protein refolding chaperone
MDQFRGFNPPFRKKALEISEAMAQTRRAMLEEMAAPVSDTLKLNRMADSIGRLHEDLKKLTWHYYLDLKSICTADQQVLLKKLFTDMFINDIPMGHPGRGPGWQRGRNR